MQIGGESGLAHPAEELAEGGISRPAFRQVSSQLAAQDQGVDEAADQRLDLAVCASGDRGAHREIVLPGEAGEERLEAGEEHHEQGRSGAPGEGLGLPGEPGRQPHGPRGPPVALHRRPGAVGGEGEERRQAGELAAPPADLPLQDLAAQPGMLPYGEICILHRQLGQGRRPTRGALQ